MAALCAGLLSGATVRMATFFGGIGNDSAVQVLTGPNGHIFIAGVTDSPDLPQNRLFNSPLNRPHDLAHPDAFVARMSPDGSAVDWSLSFGGLGAEGVISAVADAAGAVYVLGWTASPDFPATPGAWQTRMTKGPDTFLAKVHPDGSRLEWATFLGFFPDSIAGGERGLLAVDGAGTVFVAGRDAGPDLRPTPGAYRATNASGQGFVIRLNARGSAPLYATYLHAGAPTVIRADASGALLIAGNGGRDFENVLGSPGGAPDTGFAMKLNSEGTAAVFRTRLQASRSLTIDDAGIDAAGAVYLLGSVLGADFPGLNPLPQTPAPPQLPDHPFLARLTADGKTLLAATSFSGREFQWPLSSVSTRLRMSVRPDGSLCLLNLPLTPAGQTPGGLGTKTIGGPGLVCVAEGLSRYLFRTMIPTAANHPAASLLWDRDGSVLLAGTTTEIFSPTPGAAQPRFGGGYDARNRPQPPSDAFLMRIVPSDQPPRLRALSPGALLSTSLPPGPAQPGPVIRLYGENFTAGLEADVEGRRLPLEIDSPTQATLPWTDPSLFAPAELRLTLSLPVPGAIPSEEKILTIYNPTPDAPLIVPNAAPQNSSDVRITVRAQGLTPSSTLLWNGTPRQAAYRAQPVPSMELALTAADVAQAGRVEVHLSNPGPGGGPSVPAFFTVTAPDGSQSSIAPTLDPWLDPFLDAAPGQSLTRQIGGRHLSSSTRVLWNGESLAVTFVSAQSLRITFPSELIARGGQGVLVASNGSLLSNGIPVHLVRPRPVTALAVDPVRRRSYEVEPEAERQLLRVVDLDSNEVLHQREIAPDNNFALPVISVSEDGRFVYWIRPDNGTLSRLNADTLELDVDLQFADPGAWPVSILPLPDRTGAFVLRFRNGEIAVYDGPAQRGPSLFDLGLFQLDPAAGPENFLFATRDKIFGITHLENDFQCLPSIRYNAFGITGLDTDCRNAATPELKFDRGLTYLAADDRVHPLRLAVSSLSQLSQLDLKADLTRRSIIASRPGQATLRINLDTLQTETLLPRGDNFVIPLSTREIVVRRPAGIVLLKLPEQPGG